VNRLPAEKEVTVSGKHWANKWKEGTSSREKAL